MRSTCGPGSRCPVLSGHGAGGARANGLPLVHPTGTCTTFGPRVARSNTVPAARFCGFADQWTSKRCSRPPRWGGHSSFDRLAGGLRSTCVRRLCPPGLAWPGGSTGPGDLMTPRRRAGQSGQYHASETIKSTRNGVSTSATTVQTHNADHSLHAKASPSGTTHASGARNAGKNGPSS